MRLKDNRKRVEIGGDEGLPALTVVSDFRHPTVSARTQFNAMAKQL